MLGQLSSEASPQRDPLGIGDCPAPLDDLCQQLHIGRKRDVLFLDRGVHRDLDLLGRVTVQCDRGFENHPSAVLADALAEVDQVCGVARKLPLEMCLAAEGLIVGIADPGFDYAFVAQVLELLEDHKPNHESDGLCRSAMLAVEAGKLLLETLPGDCRREPEQGILGIELVEQIVEEEIGLILLGWLSLHEHPQSGDSTTCFLQNHCSFWSRMIHRKSNFFHLFQSVVHFQGRLYIVVAQKLVRNTFDGAKVHKTLVGSKLRVLC